LQSSLGPQAPVQYGVTVCWGWNKIVRSILTRFMALLRFGNWRFFSF
jgi:hypothetical protein